MSRPIEGKSEPKTSECVEDDEEDTITFLRFIKAIGVCEKRVEPTSGGRTFADPWRVGKKNKRRQLTESIGTFDPAQGRIPEIKPFFL